MRGFLGTTLVLALCVTSTGPAAAGPHAEFAQSPAGPARAHYVAFAQAPAASTSPADAGSHVDFGTRARGAGRVVVAAVEDTQPRFDVNEYGDRLIITRAILRVEETLKGSQVDVVEIDVEGGTIGDLTLNVSDLPALHRGDRGVFFLTTTKTTVHRPHDRGFGIVKLDASNHVAGSTTTLAEVKAAVRAAR